MKYLILTISIFTINSLTSCNNNDNSSSVIESPQLEGTWKIYQFILDDYSTEIDLDNINLNIETNCFLIQFNSDQTYSSQINAFILNNETNSYNCSEENPTIVTDLWNVNNNNTLLILTVNGQKTYIPIIDLTKTTLIIRIGIPIHNLNNSIIMNYIYGTAYLEKEIN